MILRGEAARRVREMLEEIAPLRAELRRLSMIYQVEEKQYAAQRQGLPLDTYYHTPYAEWAAVRAVWGFNGAGRET